MGLAEKRILEQLKNKYTAELLPQLKESTPFPIEVEVVWDDIYKQMGDSDITFQEALDYFSGVFVTPTVAAFKSICADDLGTTSLKSMLNKVKFCCTSDNCVNQAYSFANQTLSVDHYRANIDEYYTKERTEYLTKFLEKLL